MSRHRFKKNSVFHDIIQQQYDDATRFNLIRSVKGSKDWVQRLSIVRTLPIHTGCVNCISWNEKGDKLISGSDDQHLVITNPYNYKVQHSYKSSHRANIFSAKFLPCTSDVGVVSCSGDGMILHSDLLRLEYTHLNMFNCHVGTTYEIATIPEDPNCFISCGEDCTVRYFDLRVKQKCHKSHCLDDVIITSQRAVTAVVVNMTRPYQIAIGCSDSTVRIYDRRMLGLGNGISAQPFASYIPPGMKGHNYRITSLNFSPDGEDILVSYSSEHVYLVGINNKEIETLSTEETAEHSDNGGEIGSDGFPSLPIRRLRLRGDWSDTGPNARPQNETALENISQARPRLHTTLMQRMTEVLSRMLNDPATRAALSHGGEDSYIANEESQSSQSEPSAQVPDTQASLQPPRLPTIEIPENDSEDEEELPSPAQDTPVVPLPSFSSTYSSFVKQPSEDKDTETESSSNRYHDGPSTSAGPPPAKKDKPSDPHLNEFSSVYHGFVEKHGKEPMVNLKYSGVGSEASSVSVFVKNDEKDSEDSQDTEISDNVVADQAPPQQTPIEQAETHEEELGNSSESDVDLEPLLRDDCYSRRVHPIERDMEKAIENARDQLSDSQEELLNKTRRFVLKQKYTGHRNARTMIKEATFWGDHHIISGSDCGHVFMWDRETAKLVMLLQADQHVVNCVQPHPFLPILATSGIDHDVKLWAPGLDSPSFDSAKADELMKRNAIMLEETKDTITVPASFMIRMLACLNQLRRGGRGRLQRRQSNTNSD